MKTAVLLTGTCKNDPPDDVSPVKSNDIGFRLQCCGVEKNHTCEGFTDREGSISNSNIFKGSFNVDVCHFYFYFCAPRSLTAKFFSLISFLNSLRCYFNTTINKYFCFECQTHFKKVILLERSFSCNACMNILLPAHLILSEYFNSVYSAAYPSEPKVFVMGCLCKETVFKKRSIIHCGCIDSYKHLDHGNILKTVFRCERRLQKKVLSLCLLTYSLQNSFMETIIKLKDHEKLLMLQYNKQIFNSELIDLQIEFYNSCNSLYVVLFNNIHLQSRESIHQHLKRFTYACISRKFIFPNFRYLLRDFILFYERAFVVDSHKNNGNLKLIPRKAGIICSDYSELMLLFGFYLYCLKILKFSKEKSITISSKILLSVDTWQKKQILKLFIKICYIYYIQFVPNKSLSSLKRYVHPTGRIRPKYSEDSKIIFPRSQGIACNVDSSKPLVVRNNENKTVIYNFKSVNMSTNSLDILKSQSLNHQSHHTPSLNSCPSKMILSSFKEINSKNKSQILSAVSTGKEEIDVIDGVTIFSFKNQPDMMEFSMLQNRLIGLNECDILQNPQINYTGRIIPTKTRDITKIKGWRNKIFCINKNERNHVSDPTTVATDATKHSKFSIENCRSEVSKSIVIKKDKEKPKEDDMDYYKESSEMIVKNEKEIDKMKIKEEPLDDVNLSFKFKNGINLKEFVNDLNRMHLDLLVEEKKLANISDRLSNQGESDGVFTSKLLDEYLENFSDLKVNFEMTKSYSPNISSDEVTNMSTPIAVNTTNKTGCKKEDMKKNIEKLSSTDFIKNMLGDISKRKFIWVRGRPIMIEHEKKPSTNSSSKKRPSNSESMDETSNSEKDEIDLKKIKITKQLDYNDVDTISLKSQQSIESECKKPYLSLLNTCKMDDSDEIPNIYPKSLAEHKFPLIFPCTSEIDDHSECTKFNKVQLVMVLNVGYNRPFPIEVTNNIEKLKKDDTLIDSMWANIAASAVNTKEGSKIKRFIIPVVSDSLIEVVKFNIENVTTNIANINELNVHSVYRSICESSKLADAAEVIDNEIKSVVEDIIDYVVKKEDHELLKFPYDPDLPDRKANIKLPVKRVKKSKVEREIKRLINVSFVDDWNESNDTTTGRNSCGNEYCSKGCICSSLNGKLRVMHCGKLGCMFECSCDSKPNYSFNALHGRHEKLAKDESQWHQTVICKNNEIIEVKAGGGKSKREKKLPTRFRNNVLLGKEMNCLDLFPSIFETSKKLSISPKDNKSKDKEFKIKDKPAKVKIKDKEKNITEKDKEVKLTDKDKEVDKIVNEVSEIIEKDKKVNKTNEKDGEVKIIEIDSESKKKVNTKQKNIDESYENEKVIKLKPINNEKDIEKNLKIQKSKVLLPIRPLIKKVDSKQKSLISSNLNQILNQSDLNKMTKICREENTYQLTLADVFIWCSIHSRYSCPCSAQVFILKNNRLVWKPTARITHLTSKLMSQIVITKSLPKYHIYNQSCHSARTFGSLFNYKLRNSNPVFKSKRLNEVVNNVLSNTNSFIKIDFSTNQPDQFKTTPETMKQADKQACKSNTNGIIVNQEPLLKANISISDKEKKRKRNSKELEIQPSVNMQNSASYVISINKDDVIKQNAKKKYRIGPAHFDWMGNYRTIVSNSLPKNSNKSNSIPKAIENPIKDSLNESKDSEIKILPKYGLLCLTQGFGYLPVKEFTPKKLQVQDPLSENVFHCFRDIDSANKWLNRFFKNRIVFESLSVNLKWVIVKPGILKHSKPFDKALLENPSKIVNKDGFLVDVTNINGYGPHYYGSSSITSEIQQADKLKKPRTLDIQNDDIAETNETPLKKIKISSENLWPDKKISLNRTLIKAKIVPKPIGVLKRISQDTFPIKTAIVPSTKLNHSNFFRLSNSPDSSVSEGCFIPILPTTVQPQNVHGAKHKENENNLNSNSVKTSNVALELNTNSQESILVTRPKTIPIGIKAMPGKSILKTNLSKM